MEVPRLRELDLKTLNSQANGHAFGSVMHRMDSVEASEIDTVMVLYSSYSHSIKYLKLVCI